MLIVFAYSSDGEGGLSGCGVTSGLIKLADLLLEQWSLFKGAGNGRPEAHPPPAHQPRWRRRRIDASAAADPEPSPARWGWLLPLKKRRPDNEGGFAEGCACLCLSVCLSVWRCVKGRALF